MPLLCHGKPPLGATARRKQRYGREGSDVTGPLSPSGADGTSLASSIRVNLQALSEADLPLSYERGAIDPVLVEILAATHFLVTSPEVIRLEAELAKEFL